MAEKKEIPASDLLPDRETGQQAIDVAVKDIQSFTPQNFAPSSADLRAVNMLSRAVPDQPSPGAFGRASLFPGINDPILKGQASSQTLGSQPIFVGSGGFFPFDALAQREKALQDAASKRALQLKAFDESIDVPAVKDPRFQKKLTERTFGTVKKFIDEARETFGDQAIPALSTASTDIGRRFQLELSNLNTLAKSADQAIDAIAEVKKDRDEGTKIFSDQTHELIGDFDAMLGRFESGDPVNLTGMMNLVQGHMALDKFLQDRKIAERIGSDLSQRLAGITDKGDFDLIVSKHKKDSDAQIQEIAQRLKENEFRANPFFTEEDIAKAIGSFVERERKDIIKTQSTPQRAKARFSGRATSPDEVTFQRTGKFNVGGSEVTAAGKTDIGTKDAKTPINIAGAVTITEDGTKLEEDVQEIQAASIANMNFLDEGVLTADQVAGMPSNAIMDVPGKGTIVTDEGVKALSLNFPQIASQVRKAPVLVGETQTEVEERDVTTGKTKRRKAEKTTYTLIEGNQERIRREFPNELVRHERETGIVGYDPQTNKAQFQGQQTQPQTKRTGASNL